MPQAAELEALFLALADRTRLRLLNVIGDAEVCVCFFIAALRLPQPTISRHLAYLRRQGLVTARREGKWMHYRIQQPRDAAARKLLKGALEALAQDPELERDRARFSSACCSPKFLSMGAPQPGKAAR